MYGELMRTARKRRHIGSVELATRLGRNQSFISRIETGAIKETPPPDVLNSLEQELGVPVSDQLRALGYALDDPTLGDAVSDPDLADIMEYWKDLNDDQRDLIYALIDRMMTPPAQRPSVIRERRTG